MVCGRVLDNQTLITVDALVLDGLLDGPFTNVCPLFVGVISGFLLGVGRLPSLVPVIGELLEEVPLESGGLQSNQGGQHIPIEPRGRGSDSEETPPLQQRSSDWRRKTHGSNGRSWGNLELHSQ